MLCPPKIISIWVRVPFFVFPHVVGFLTPSFRYTLTICMDLTKKVTSHNWCLLDLLNLVLLDLIELDPYLWIWMYEDGDKDEKEKERRRWRKVNKVRCWWCTIRSTRYALSNGCHLGRKKIKRLILIKLTRYLADHLQCVSPFIHWVNLREFTHAA